MSIRQKTSISKREASGERVKGIKPGRIILLLLILVAAIRTAVDYVDVQRIKNFLSPYITVRGIRVEGLSMLSEDAVLDALDMDSLLFFMDVNSESIESVVSRINGVADVRSRLTLRGELVISVTERVPLAYGVIEGFVYFIDNSGAIWPFKTGQYYDIPVISGLRDYFDSSGQRRVEQRDFVRFKRVRDLFIAGRRGESLVSADFANPDMIKIRIKGISPQIWIASEPSPYLLSNLDALFAYFEKNLVSVEKYIDLSHQNVAFFR